MTPIQQQRSRDYAGASTLEQFAPDSSRVHLTIIRRALHLSFRTCDTQLPPPTLSPLNAEGFVVFEFLHQFS